MDFGGGYSREKRENDLELEEDISISYNMEKHWKDIIEVDNNVKGKVCAFRWGFCTKYKERLIKRVFSMEVPHLKGERIFLLIQRIILSKKRRKTGKSDYLDSIIHNLNKRRLKVL